VRRRLDVEPEGHQLGIECTGVDARAVGQQREAGRGQARSHSPRDRPEGGPVVEYLGEQDQVEPARNPPGCEVGRHHVDGVDAVRRRAGAHERERGGRPVDEGDRRPAARRRQAGEPQAAAQLDGPSRPRGHGIREHPCPAPEMRPVRRLGRVVAREQRVTIDVPLEVIDLPECDTPGVQRHLRQDRAVAGEHPAALCVVSIQRRCYGDPPQSTSGWEESMEEMARLNEQIVDFAHPVNGSASGPTPR
jgi:hypothetical protein